MGENYNYLLIENDDSYFSPNVFIDSTSINFSGSGIINSEENVMIMNNNNKILMIDGTGIMTDYAPTYENHLTNKSYVDSYVTNYVDNYFTNYMNGYVSNYVTNYVNTNVNSYVDSYVSNYFTNYMNGYVSNYVTNYVNTNVNSYVDSYVSNYFTNYMNGYVSNYVTNYVNTNVNSYVVSQVNNSKPILNCNGFSNSSSSTATSVSSNVPIFLTFSVLQVNIIVASQQVLIFASLMTTIAVSATNIGMTVGYGTSATPTTSYINLANNLSFASKDISVSDTSSEQNNLNTLLCCEFIKDSSQGQTLNCSVRFVPPGIGTYYFVMRFVAGNGGSSYFRNCNIISLIV